MHIDLNKLVGISLKKLEGLVDKAEYTCKFALVGWSQTLFCIWPFHINLCEKQKTRDTITGNCASRQNSYYKTKSIKN